jgi:transcriptional regulator with PAS, ATPase and Fis domain
MARLRQQLCRVAPAAASVLFLGETGTGKEVAARYVHAQSGRPEPFVAVNCGALPETLAESQLFGHTRGAFTGAAAHPGFFRSAQQGTLLLDEIGELPLPIQPKLLRVLEERMVFPVGSVVGQPLGARLLFATNRNILAAVSSGKFRADLYSRIAELVVELPPLRTRREDIFLLLSHYLSIKSELRLPVSLAEALLLYDWPFNVRELVKLASELSITSDLAAIEARLRRPITEAVPRPPPSGHSPEPVETDSNAPAREQLIELLRSHQGNVAAVARTLKCLRKYVYRWIEQYALDLNEYRVP